MCVGIEEQETIISIERTCDIMRFYTTDREMMAKLDKYYPRTKEHKTKGGYIVAVEYELPKSILYHCLQYGGFLRYTKQISLIPE